MAEGEIELRAGDQVLAVLEPGKEEELRKVLLRKGVDEGFLDTPCWPLGARGMRRRIVRGRRAGRAAGYRFVQVRVRSRVAGARVCAAQPARPRLRRRAGRTDPDRPERPGHRHAARHPLRDVLRRAGLLSVAFHPRFARNGKYYVNYTDRGGDSRVVEYRGRRRLRQLMFWDDPYSNHNGGQNAFGPTAASTSAWATPERAAIPRTARRTSARRSASCSRSTSTVGERGGRSWATACGTPGGSRSTARPATSTSATSARTAGRRSTSRPGGAPASRTTAGTSTRAVRASRTSR